MEKVINAIKRVEVSGSTKEEALAKAPFFIQGDATQAFKKWKETQVNGVTDADIKQFCVNYIAKKSKNAPGVGFSVTLESAVADTRERPYTIENLKNDKGARKYKTIYSWIDDATGTEVVSVDTNKAEAQAAIKKLYSDKGYKGNATLVMNKKCVEGQAVVAKAKYTPSKSSRVGRYLCFGVENF